MEIRDFGFKFIGKLGSRKSTEIVSSRLGVGFETLDRDMWDVEQAWPVLEGLGVKWARVQSGWAKTEKENGAYDFSWLDIIVDKLLERGVQPWLSVSYGNRLYTPDAAISGVGYPPVYTEEERQGWRAYVRALSAHYRGRVRHFEVWNEPDAGFFGPKQDPALYAALVKATAEVLKSQQPDAFVICGAFGRAMHPGGLLFTENCLKHGMAEQCNAISYHGYKVMPEQYIDQEFPAYLRLLRKYKPGIEYWQGETGCPSKVPPGNDQALADMPVNEGVQMRWLLRRILLELGLDAALVSYFTMGDFSHYVMGKNLNYSSHYGLLRLEDGSPKPAYYALQSLATLLHDPLKPAEGATSFRMQNGDDDKSITREQAAAAYQVNLLRGDVPVHAWWLRESVEKDSDWKSITMYYWLDQGLRLDNPVLVDPAGKDVYELGLKINYGMPEFANLPISNSPLLLTDRSIVPIL
ncbi:MAG: beta-galactosidase [Victivallales bacterium]|jgi:hypothetical protein